jgi:hypothetical protein
MAHTTHAYTVATHAVDDQHGNQITIGTRRDCINAACRYLSTHPDATCVELYDVVQFTSEIIGRSILPDDGEVA